MFAREDEAGDVEVELNDEEKVREIQRALES